MTIVVSCAHGPMLSFSLTSHIVVRVCGLQGPKATVAVATNHLMCVVWSQMHGFSAMSFSTELGDVQAPVDALLLLDSARTKVRRMVESYNSGDSSNLNELKNDICLELARHFDGYDDFERAVRNADRRLSVSIQPGDPIDE